MNTYIGNTLQLYGVEEMRLVGGKADGMRILRVRNNAGLDFEISLDRCGDIARISLKGDNLGYFAPCGYVAPQYYDNKGAGFLKSFTAGFFTTCGLTQVGGPCEDDGEELPLHGNISHVPCENFAHWIEGDEIHIRLTVRDASMFSHQLVLEREYVCKINENVLYLTDTVKNIGSRQTPLELLYHCNMGYPLLSENAIVDIPCDEVIAKDALSESGLETRLKMEKPQRGYEEQDFFYKVSGKPTVSIFNPDIQKGLEMSFDAKELGWVTEWKMMGEFEYVLGLEPGNCVPVGREEMRKSFNLEFLDPQAERTFHVTFRFKG